MGFEIDIPSMPQPVDSSTKNSRNCCICDIFIQPRICCSWMMSPSTHTAVAEPLQDLCTTFKRKQPNMFMIGVVMFITSIPLWHPLSKIRCVPFNGRYWTAHHTAQSLY
jgi:hypothetical protein